MRYYANLRAARRRLDDDGGWLLRSTTDIGTPGYMVTQDEGTVRDMRGDEFVVECARRQIWDETKL